jgi:hypothetical protein
MPTLLPCMLATMIASAAAQAPAPPAAFARVGDFVWLENSFGHNTTAIRRLEPQTNFVCLETAHFRVTCSMAERDLPGDSKERKKFLDELQALRARGVTIPKTVRKIDCNLWAHVYALRLENLYTDMLRRFGVSDADFPTDPAAHRDPSYLGEGPFFGARQRILVLLCEHENTLARYCDQFHRQATHAGLRHFVREAGAFFFGIAVRGQHLAYETDQTMHAAVAYSITHILVDAFKYCWHETPYWLQEGLAHWQRRHVDDRFDHFSFLPTGLPEKNRHIDWAASVRARVVLGNFTPLRDMLPWLDDRQIEFAEHLAIWSRIDFLLRKHQAAFGRFMRAVKGPETRGHQYSPTPEVVVARQIEALRQMFGWTPEEFDRAWVAFVKETYPK